MGAASGTATASGTSSRLGTVTAAGAGSGVRILVPTGGTGTDASPTQSDAWPYSTGTAQSGTVKLARHDPGDGSSSPVFDGGEPVPQPTQAGRPATHRARARPRSPTVGP